MKKIIFGLIVAICLVLAALVLRPKEQLKAITTMSIPTKSVTPTATIDSPLAISTMKAKSYPGSDLVVEQTLPSGSSYSNYLVSYQSDGLKMYGQLTVPKGTKPQDGWPVILFNHGYIPPAQYNTQTSYSSFITPFASAGYIVFKPDYRGNGNSEGEPTQVYVSPDYFTDSMNALASVIKYKDADPNNIGVFGHSMGGNIVLHQLVLSSDVKAAVIAAGVVGSYSELFTWWEKRDQTGVLTTQNDLQTLDQVKQFLKDHGTPTTNASFYQAIDPTNFLSDINAPVQLLVGTNDQTVPPTFSQGLRDKLDKLGKQNDYQEYAGADHNLSPNTSAALSQAFGFFNKHLK